MKAVILAGGGGTRLWPLSHPERPKQFQKLVSEKTLLEETIDRLDFLKPEDIYLAINKNHLPLVREIAKTIPEKNIIIEPDLRDTAPCIGLAATIIEKRHPGETMGIFYADHLIQNKEEFQKKLKIADQLAREQNTINIIEVEASEPNINYGYVKVGSPVHKIDDTEIFSLQNFTEKPDIETARKFLEAGNYLWNTGLYVWKTATLLNLYKQHQPESHDKLQQIMDHYDTEHQEKTLHAIYPTMDKISLDYAIMEKVNPSQVRIIKADLGWSDIGSFKAIWEELRKKPEENISRGQTQLIDCKGCLVYSDAGKKVAAIGLEDLVIIDTKDGILVCKKEDSKRVKELN